MGTIAQEITRINGAKADLKTAIEKYGETIPASTLIDGYAPYIDNISGGSWLPSPSTILATFSRRQSGGQGPATVEKIYGRSIVWNQLAPDDLNNFVVNTAYATKSYSDGVLTATVTAATSNGYFSRSGVFSADCVGHKLLLLADIKVNSSAASVNLQFEYPGITSTMGAQTISTGSWQRAKMISVVTQAAGLLLYYDKGTVLSVGDTADLRNVNAFDLTAIFGAGNEPTIAEFEALYQSPKYPYSANILTNLTAEALVTRGINQWDEIKEGGGIDATTGQNATDSHCFRSKNYIAAFPSTAYYLYRDGCDGTFYTFEYDANYAFLGRTAYTTATTSFTTGANTAFVRFQFCKAGSYWSSNLPSYRICINISSPAINGQYFPYRGCYAGLPILKHFPDGLKSVGSGANMVYDELTPTTKIQRVDTRAYQAGDEDDPTLTTDGTNTNYPLATPVETDIDEDMTYLPDLGGTEEVTPITAPFTADIRYTKEI